MGGFGGIDVKVVNSVRFMQQGAHNFMEIKRQNSLCSILKDTMTSLSSLSTFQKSKKLFYNTHARGQNLEYKVEKREYN